MDFTDKDFRGIRDSLLNDISARGLITDLNVGSVARTLTEAYARELVVLYEAMQNVYNSAFVDTATGQSLDFVVSILGITRIDADRAEGRVVFSRGTPATGDITIRKGTIVTTQGTENGGQPPLFETSGEQILRKGDREIEVSVSAREKGEEGVVEANTITVMPRPIEGIETVINPEPTVLRRKKESDEELRERAKNALQNTGKATKNAINFAIRRLGAQSVEIVEMPEDRVGEVEVIVDGSALKETARQQAIQDAINDSKAAGIRARVLVTKRIHLFLRLRLTLKNPVEIREELDAILENVRAHVQQYVSSLEMGESVRSNGIISAALQESNIADIEFLPVDEGTPDLLFKTGNIKEAERIYEDDSTIRQRSLPKGDIHFGKYERAVLDAATDLELEVKERKYSVYLDIRVTRLVLSGEPRPQEKLKADLGQNIEQYVSEFEDRRAGKESDSPFSYDLLLSALQLPGYMVRAHEMEVVLLHTLDGLETTLQVSGQRDTIKPNEEMVLRTMQFEVNVSA